METKILCVNTELKIKQQKRTTVTTEERGAMTDQ
jgi:hypothetical protein